MNLLLRRPAPRKIPGEPSIDAIFEEDLEFIVRVVDRLGVPSADVLDVAQEVLQAAHEALPTFDRSRRLRPWLFGIAVRQVGHYLEGSRRRREEPIDGMNHVQISDHAPTSEERMILDERRRLVHDALSSLPLDQRAVFIGYELDEMKMEDVAESLGIPEGTAWTRLRAARKRFEAAVLRRRGSFAGGVMPLPMFGEGWRRWGRLRQAFKTIALVLSGAVGGGAGVHLAMSRPAPVVSAVVHESAVVNSAEARSAEPEKEPPARVASASASAGAPAAPPMQRSASAAPAPAVAASTSGDVELGAEQALMLAASTAFGRGDDAAVLASLAEHARRFPQGRHAAGREALWIKLLVRQGRSREAGERLTAFERAFPDSKMMPMLRALVQEQ